MTIVCFNGRSKCGVQLLNSTNPYGCMFWRPDVKDPVGVEADDDRKRCVECGKSKEFCHCEEELSDLFQSVSIGMMSKDTEKHDHEYKEVIYKEQEAVIRRWDYEEHLLTTLVHEKVKLFCIKCGEVKDVEKVQLVFQ